MSDRQPRHIDSVAALAEPVRRRLYEFVASQGQPVDRDMAAAGVGIGRPLAAFHLDRLAEAALLDVEFRRRSGRTGPGAGRPAKFYARPADHEVSVSLPPRQYDLAAEILAQGVERRKDAAQGVLEAAHERGAELAAEASAAGATTGREGLLDLLAINGYEPVIEADGTIRLRNCPFHALVEDHRQLTCSMNLAMLSAAVAGLDGTGVAAEAQPREGFCCVAFVPEAPEP